MDANGKSILVVDDQDGVCQLLQELLVSEGFQVSTACNGYKALELIEALSPAILIIDMKMPGMSGIDVLTALQNMKHNCVPIMMTAYGELEIIKEAAKLGVSHFITKPFDIDELRNLIKKVTESLETETN
jgi:two-component system response regulator (stage 0 sporulation protein F)